MRRLGIHQSQLGDDRPLAAVEVSPGGGYVATGGYILSVYIYLCVCMCVYIYICVFIFNIHVCDIDTDTKNKCFNPFSPFIK